MSSSNDSVTSKAFTSDIPVARRANHANHATSSERVNTSLSTDPRIHRAPSNGNTSANNQDAGIRNEFTDTGSQSYTNDSFTLPRLTRSDKGKGKAKESDTADAANEHAALPLPVPSEKSKGKQRAIREEETGPTDDDPFTEEGQEEAHTEKLNEWTHLAANQYGSPENHLKDIFALSKTLSNCAEIFLKAWPSTTCKLGSHEFIKDVFYNLPNYEAEVSTCAQILVRKMNERFKKRPWTIVEKIDSKLMPPPPMFVTDPETGIPREIPQVRVQRPHLELGDKPFAMEIRRHAVRHYSGNFSVEFRPAKPAYEGRLISPPPGRGVRVIEGKTEEYDIHRHPIIDIPIDNDDGTPFGNGPPTSPVNETEDEWFGTGLFDVVQPTNTADSSGIFTIHSRAETPDTSSVESNSSQPSPTTTLLRARTASAPSVRPTQVEKEELGAPSISQTSAKSQLEVEEVAISVLARSPSASLQTKKIRRGEAATGAEEASPKRSASTAAPLVRRRETNQGTRLLPIREPSPPLAEVAITIEEPARGRRGRPRGKTMATRSTTERGKKAVVETKKKVEGPTAAEVLEEAAPVKRATRGKGKAKSVPVQTKGKGGKGKEKEAVEEPAVVVEVALALKRGQKRGRHEVEKVIPEGDDFNRPTRRLRSYTKKMGAGL